MGVMPGVEEPFSAQTGHCGTHVVGQLAPGSAGEPASQLGLDVSKGVPPVAKVPDGLGRRIQNMDSIGGRIVEQGLFARSLVYKVQLSELRQRWDEA